jgi:hypothetical protein
MVKSQKSWKWPEKPDILKYECRDSCQSKDFIPSRNALLFTPLKTEFLHNFINKSSLYLTGNSLRLRYKAQPVNAVWGNSRCLL